MGLDELSALVGLLNGDCTTSELALRIGTSLAATERSVSRLQKQGYATTIDLNRLHLTDEGVERAQRRRAPL